MSARNLAYASVKGRVSRQLPNSFLPLLCTHSTVQDRHLCLLELPLVLPNHTDTCPDILLMPMSSVLFTPDHTLRRPVHDHSRPLNRPLHVDLSFLRPRSTSPM